MIFKFTAFVAILSVAFSAAATRHPAQSKFVVEIIPSQNAISPGVAVWKKGDPVFLIIHMTNNSGKTLHFGLMNPVYDYRAIVLDSHGNRVAETGEYRELRKQSKSSILAASRNILVVLKPHQTCTDTIEVSYLLTSQDPVSIRFSLNGNPLQKSALAWSHPTKSE